jgi:hypothetical protein
MNAFHKRICILLLAVTGCCEAAQSAPTISSVNSILPQNAQTIIIRGSGFGSTSPKTQNLGDSVDTIDDATTPSLAIRDHGTGADSWAAGRITSGNFDAIGLKLASWSDTEIVLNGFGSALGGQWKIAAGDPIEVVVFGPANSGSTSFNTVVVNSSSQPTQNSETDKIGILGSTPGSPIVPVQADLEVMAAPLPPSSPNGYQFLIFPPQQITTVVQPTDSTTSENTSKYSAPEYTTYPINTGVATEGQPFTITYQVKNTTAQTLSLATPPKLVGISVVGTIAGVNFQNAPNATFKPTLINPPANILPGQTVPLTYQVTADWETFVPPSNPISSNVANAENTISYAQEMTDVLTAFTKLSSSAEDILSSAGDVMTAINELSTWSLFVGTKIYIAQYYSFGLRDSNGNAIPDSFSQSENVWVIWQPYKTDVMTAYYMGIFVAAIPVPSSTPLNQMAQLITQLENQPGVAKIMKYYPVQSNLCWYEQAFSGSLPFYSSSQFPCTSIENQDNLVTASFNCGNGPVPSGPCPGNNSQNNSNSGNSSVNSITPGLQKWPTVSEPTTPLPPTTPHFP